jgi:hypothetical protein
MGQRTKCPHDSDKAPIINDYSNCSHRRTENGPAGASGTMPFSEFVFSSENFMYLQPYGKVKRVRAGQAYRATLFLFCRL